MQHERLTLTSAVTLVNVDWLTVCATLDLRSQRLRHDAGTARHISTAEARKAGAAELERIAAAIRKAIDP